MIDTLYDQLLKLYGPRGWWPISLSPNKPNSLPYHQGDYSIPTNDLQRLEIAIGAILTQNTAWTNVQKALDGLAAADLFGVEAITQAATADLSLAIRSAGYFNQKAGYLQEFVGFLAQQPFSQLQQLPLSEARKALLSVKGIGAETADCILLYALGHPIFVVDAYTKRFLQAMGLVGERASYAQMQEIFHQAIPPHLQQYQEFHALLVEHGKRHYSKRPYGLEDPLLKLVQTKKNC